MENKYCYVTECNSCGKVLNRHELSKKEYDELTLEGIEAEQRFVPREEGEFVGTYHFVTSRGLCKRCQEEEFENIINDLQINNINQLQN